MEYGESRCRRIGNCATARIIPIFIMYDILCGQYGWTMHSESGWCWPQRIVVSSNHKRRRNLDQIVGSGDYRATINTAADLETEYYWTLQVLGKILRGGSGIWRSCDAGSTWERIIHFDRRRRIEIAARYLDAWEMYSLVTSSNARSWH